MKNRGTSISSNIVWRFLERFSAKIVTFFVSVVLARLLDPTTYGTVALVTVFTAVLEVFVDSGLGSALIQKKDADDADFSSVFYFNIVICTTLYILMFFAAPYIASFYEIPELVSIVRVMNLTLIISGVKNILHAYISKKMQFKLFFYATLAGTIISAIVGLVMAFMGCGVWALVVQPLVNYSIDTVVLWYCVDWRPKRVFSITKLKTLLSFGWKILVSKLVNVVYSKSRDLIIGKMYSPDELAFFNKGDSFPAVIVPNITASIDGVMFPAMVQEQDNLENIRELVKKSVHISSYLVMPMMAGLIACGKPLVCALLTEKWIQCVPYLCMFCVVYAFWPFSIANMNAIKALGHSDVIMKLEIIEKIFSITLLVAAVKKGVFWIGISYMCGELFSSVLCAVPNRKLLNYGFLKQFKDLFPVLFASSVMGAITYLIQFIGFSDILTLVIQIPLGVVIYLVLSYLLKLQGFTFFMEKIKKKVQKRDEGESV